MIGAPITIVLSLLLLNAGLGAFDTLWYHEYRARLPERIDTTATELRLHVGRDAVYVVLYGTLAWLRPIDAVGLLIAAGLLIEIALTMADFVVEDRDRPAIGGMSPGERILHSVMAIVYGAMLAFLVPVLVAGIGDGGTGEPTLAAHGAPVWLSVAASAAALGIAVSGLRDAFALRGHDPVSRWLPRPSSALSESPVG